jgi:hypothetical protein
MEMIDQLLREALDALDEFWFVQSLDVVERTDRTVTVQLMIGNGLRVQAFLSQKTGRINLALIGPSGRLYGRDRQHGEWHKHPFSQPDSHEATPEGVSRMPLLQFMAEVQEILITQNLI